jgi:hypothetical protein
MVLGGQRHAPAALPPGKRPSTHRTVGWVGPSTGLDGCGKSLPHRDSILGFSNHDYAIPCFIKFIVPLNKFTTYSAPNPAAYEKLKVRTRYRG